MPVGQLFFGGIPGPWPGSSLVLGQDLTPIVLTISPNSGRNPGGTLVTITGFNFRYNNDGTSPTVLIGGVAATGVVVVNSTTITATTGAASVAGLVDVKVTIQGLTGTLKGAFTYYSGKIQSISPLYGNIVGGTPVTIKGFNFIAGCQITFGGIAATKVVFIDSNTYTCVTPAHAFGFVDVQIIEPA